MLFISHASRDRAAVEWLSSQLRRAGYGTLFVDFDPEHGILPGRAWEPELYSRLRKSDGLIFLASSASVASPWCFAEVTLARSLDRPIFPVNLEPDVSLPLLEGIQSAPLGPDGSGFAQLLSGLRAAGFDPHDAFTWDGARPPYPGLAPFDVADAAVFFGRAQETERLLHLLQPTLQHGPNRWVAVVGPSGSGKSSLLRAGLLPRLMRRSGQWIVVPPIVPGDRPMRNLAAALARAFHAFGLSVGVDQLVDHIGRGHDGLATAVSKLAELGTRFHTSPRVLVVIDQAEELITRTGPHERQAFVSLLSRTLHGNSPMWVVATLRSEFLSSGPDRAVLAEAIDDTLVIEPLSNSRLGEVIQQPAQRAGLTFEAGLSERIVAETTGGDALPLLAYTLRELACGAGPDGVVSVRAYDDLGGVVGALRRRADRLLDELARSGHGELVVPTLTKLATVAGSEAPTRRRVRRDAFDAAETVIVDAFVDASLLISDRDGDGSETTVQVRHEALLRQWPPLREAIETGRARLELRSELEGLAADWRQGNADESYLLRGHRLATFDRWAVDNAADLGPDERRYLDASRDRSADEIAAVRRSNRRLRLLVSSLAGLLVVAAVAGLTAWQLNLRAQGLTRLALSRQLATEAERLVDVQPDVAILSGLQSMSLAQDTDPRPSAGLITALARTTHESRLLTGHTGRIAGVAFSPDGRLLASGGNDGTVRLWDAATGQPHGEPLVGARGGATRVAFSPDGRLIATGAPDGATRLWDTATGRPHGEPLLGHKGIVNDVAFSPDGRLLATAGSDRTVRLWDAGSGRPAAALEHPSAVFAIAFSPDGRVLVSGAGDGLVRRWDPASARPAGQPLTGQNRPIYDLAFSPDGRRIAGASLLGTLKMWDAATGALTGPDIVADAGAIFSVVFSPDGRTLVSGGIDGKVRMWNLITGRLVEDPLPDHTNIIYGVAFSPDGRFLATAGTDQVVRMWTLRDAFSISRPLVGGTGLTTLLSPDGRLLATFNAPFVNFWDTDTGAPKSLLLGVNTNANGWAIRPDNGQIAIGDSKVVRFRNVASGRSEGAPLVGDALVDRVGYSPNGSLLAVKSSSDIKLWDVGGPSRTARALVDSGGTTRAMAFSPDGHLFASAIAANLRVWDTSTGRLRGTFHTDHTNSINDIAFSPDGRLIATASDDETVLLTDTATGTPHGAPLIGHTQPVRAIAFSPDGSLVASVGTDRAVRLWDVSTAQPHGPPMIGHTDRLADVAFKGNDVLVTADDRIVRSWDLGFDSWVASGCRLVNRNLSAAEWNQLTPGVPYERTCPDLPSGVGAPADAPAATYARSGAP